MIDSSVLAVHGQHAAAEPFDVCAQRAQLGILGVADDHRLHRLVPADVARPPALGHRVFFEFVAEIAGHLVRAIEAADRAFARMGERRRKPAGADGQSGDRSEQPAREAPSFDQNDEPCERREHDPSVGVRGRAPITSRRRSFQFVLVGARM